MAIGKTEVEQLTTRPDIHDNVERSQNKWRRRQGSSLWPTGSQSLGGAIWQIVQPNSWGMTMFHIKHAVEALTPKAVSRIQLSGERCLKTIIE